MTVPPPRLPAENTKSTALRNSLRHLRDRTARARATTFMYEKLVYVCVSFCTVQCCHFDEQLILL